VRCLGQVAALALACDLDRSSIARLGVAVRHHQSALGLPSPPVERIAARRLEAALRADISTVGLAAAWLGGRVMSLEQATRLGTRLLDEIGSRTVSAAATTVDAGPRLTPRERQVAVLIAQGWTNRQIAEELVIAQRTVDTHVERILAKLGFSARAQVGAWAATEGLLTPRSQHT
jgi:ATP/maltotriose-dependent transcriptional regulator MalT